MELTAHVLTVIHGEELCDHLNCVTFRGDRIHTFCTDQPSCVAPQTYQQIEGNVCRRIRNGWLLQPYTNWGMTWDVVTLLGEGQKGNAELVLI